MYTGFKVALLGLVIGLVWLGHYLIRSASDVPISDGIYERSLSMRMLVVCSEVSSVERCYKRLRGGIVKDLFGHDLNGSRMASLQRCMDSALRLRTDPLVFMRLTECLYQTQLDVGESPQQIRDQRVPNWVIALILLVFAFIVPVSIMSFGLQYQNVDNGDGSIHDGQLEDVTGVSENIKESQHEEAQPSQERRLVVNLGNDVYDLYKKKDMERWKGRFQSDRTPWDSDLVIDLDSPLEENISAIPTTAIISTAETHESNHIPVVSTIKCKARTDVNIVDESKPLPSVLSHPTTNSKGQKLRRVFLPGRGWVHAKALDEERRTLLRLLNQDDLLLNY